MRCLLVGYQRADCGLGDLHPADDRLGAEFPDVAAVADLLDVILDRVAGIDGFAEFGAVDGHEINDRWAFATAGGDADCPSRLCHSLDDKDAGHDRVFWKMPLEE